MTFLEFISKKAIEYCRVHPSYGKIAELVYQAELAKTAEFSSAPFASVRERVKMALPWAREEIAEHAECLDFAEYGACLHEQAYHEEDHSDRITELSTRLEGSVLLEGATLETVTSEWWAG